MFQPSYKRTFNGDYKGHKIECVLYGSDIGCDVDNGFLGFFVDTDSALNRAKRHIDDLILEEEKKK